MERVLEVVWEEVGEVSLLLPIPIECLLQPHSDYFAPCVAEASASASTPGSRPSVARPRNDELPLKRGSCGQLLKPTAAGVAAVKLADP